MAAAMSIPTVSGLAHMSIFGEERKREAAEGAFLNPDFSVNLNFFNTDNPAQVLEPLRQQFHDVNENLKRPTFLGRLQKVRSRIQVRMARRERQPELVALERPWCCGLQKREWVATAWIVTESVFIGANEYFKDFVNSKWKEGLIGGIFNACIQVGLVITTREVAVNDSRMLNDYILEAIQKKHGLEEMLKDIFQKMANELLARAVNATPCHPDMNQLRSTLASRIGLRIPELTPEMVVKLQDVEGANKIKDLALKILGFEKLLTDIFKEELRISNPSRILCDLMESARLINERLTPWISQYANQGAAEEKEQAARAEVQLVVEPEAKLIMAENHVVNMPLDRFSQNYTISHYVTLRQRQLKEITQIETACSLMAHDVHLKKEVDASIAATKEELLVELSLEVRKLNLKLRALSDACFKSIDDLGQEFSGELGGVKREFANLSEDVTQIEEQTQDQGVRLRRVHADLANTQVRQINNNDVLLNMMGQTRGDVNLLSDDINRTQALVSQTGRARHAIALPTRVLGERATLAAHDRGHQATRVYMNARNGAGA